MKRYLLRLAAVRTALECKSVRLPMIGLLACGLAFSATAATRDSADATARYREDRAFCNSSQSYQDRTTCLREAGAALVEARKGRLEDYGNYHENALARCAPLPADDRDACRRMVEGAGSVSGSVYAGGMLRELVEPSSSGQ